ncbi:MAG: hypothetical protein JW827_09840 [Spirochaetes bacterium]|nr:hypothetical protein [Spirochaetota bacterium]
MLKLLSFCFLLSYSIQLYASGEKSSVIFNQNPVPLSGGIDILCYGKSTDMASLVYNPAYAVVNDFSIGLATEIMPLDMNYHSLVYLGPSPFSHPAGLGIVLKYFKSGDIQGLDSAGNETGLFSLNNFMASMILGFQAGKNSFLGGRLNVINEKIDRDIDTAVSLDLGAGLGASLGAQKLNVGLSILNLGTKMWGQSQASGIGTGMVFTLKTASNAFLEYGPAFRYRSGMDWEAGGGVRYSYELAFSNKQYFKFKLGMGYFYKPGIEENGFVNGLMSGLLVRTPWSLDLGYEILFYPWGSSNRFLLAYYFRR